MPSIQIFNLPILFSSLSLSFSLPPPFPFSSLAFSILYFYLLSPREPWFSKPVYFHSFVLKYTQSNFRITTVDLSITSLLHSKFLCSSFFPFEYILLKVYRVLCSCDLNYSFLCGYVINLIYFRVHLFLLEFNFSFIFLLLFYFFEYTEYLHGLKVKII